MRADDIQAGRVFISVFSVPLPCTSSTYFPFNLEAVGLVKTRVKIGTGKSDLLEAGGYDVKVKSIYLFSGG